MRLCVIPARGGSKRIPGKNIRKFLGRPIIGYSIETARQSGCFDRIWVSTDDSEVAKVAIAEGAEVPFTRPSKLSDDIAGTNAVVRHAIEWARGEGMEPLEVCCIYATAPFLRPADVRNGLKYLESGEFRFVVAVTAYEYPIQRALRRSISGMIELMYPEYALSRSQDLEPAVHDAGQMYWGFAEAFASEDVVFGRNTYGIMLPPERVQDIDTPEDWAYAEMKYRLAEGRSEIPGCE